jgi:omega-hydroxy-beta-dihydromenaquinone-9 sulfotransferase
MSVATEPREATRPQRVVKHPFTWYMPRFWHGMRFKTWVGGLARNRFAVSPSRMPMICSITGFSMLNSTLAALDRVVYGRQVDAVELDKPPLFILGHWRAGTTFLHELLIRDPAHTFATTYQCFAPHHFLLSEKWITPWSEFLLPSRRPMDNMATGWRRPQEDEFALMNLGVPSPYLSMRFPNRGEAHPEYLTLRDLPLEEVRRWQDSLRMFLKRIALRDPRRIVIKSPAHTARVRTLLEMFPDAKFVHLARDPYSLYSSTMSLWRSLNEVQGLQAVRDDAWLPRSVLESLSRMYEAYFDDRRLLAEDQLVELRYEDLIEDPKTQLQHLYRRLDLGDFARSESAIDAHLAEVQSYRTNRHELPDPQREQVRREWERYFEEFGYE